jgi:hypothetical protein
MRNARLKMCRRLTILATMRGQAAAAVEAP